MKFDKVFTKELLNREYVEKNRTLAAIARDFGTSVPTVRLYINRAGIAFRPVSKDLTGNVFGRLTVIKRSGTDRFGKYRWSCMCECGHTCVVNGGALLRGLTKSCGCLKKELVNKKTYKDISFSYWRRFRDSAIQRGIIFEITPEEVWEQYEKQNKKCILSDLDIVFYPNSNKRYEQTASIDRIDSSKGYIKENIQIVNKVVNRMKGYLSDEEFIAFCNLIAKKNRRSNANCRNSTTRKILRKI